MPMDVTSFLGDTTNPALCCLLAEHDDGARLYLARADGFLFSVQLPTYLPDDNSDKAVQGKPASWRSEGQVGGFSSNGTPIVGVGLGGNVTWFETDAPRVVHMSFINGVDTRTAVSLAVGLDHDTQRVVLATVNSGYAIGLLEGYTPGAMPRLLAVSLSTHLSKALPLPEALCTTLATGHSRITQIIASDSSLYILIGQREPSSSVVAGASTPSRPQLFALDLATLSLSDPNGWLQHTEVDDLGEIPVVDGKIIVGSDSMVCCYVFHSEQLSLYEHVRSTHTWSVVPVPSLPVDLCLRRSSLLHIRDTGAWMVISASLDRAVFWDRSMIREYSIELPWVNTKPDEEQQCAAASSHASEAQYDESVPAVDKPPREAIAKRGSSASSADPARRVDDLPSTSTCGPSRTTSPKVNRPTRGDRQPPAGLVPIPPIHHRSSRLSQTPEGRILLAAGCSLPILTPRRRVVTVPGNTTSLSGASGEDQATSQLFVSPKVAAVNTTLQHWLIVSMLKNVRGAHQVTPASHDTRPAHTARSVHAAEHGIMERKRVRSAGDSAARGEHVHSGGEEDNARPSNAANLQEKDPSADVTCAADKTSPHPSRTRPLRPSSVPEHQPPHTKPPLAPALPSEELLVSLAACTKKGVRKVRFSFAPCAPVPTPPDMNIVARVVEASPSITALDLSSCFFDHIATAVLSAMLSNSPHLRSIDASGASFFDPTVRAVLESQAQRNAALCNAHAEHLKAARRQRRERARAARVASPLVTRRLAFYVRQRHEMELLEQAKRIDLEQGLERGLIALKEKDEGSIQYQRFVAGRDAIALAEENERQRHEERSRLEAVQVSMYDELRTQWEAESKEMHKRFDEERTRITRREVDLRKSQRRQREAVEREENTVRARVRRDEDDQRSELFDREGRRRRDIREREAAEKRRQREAEEAAALLKIQARNEELLRAEAREQMLRDHRRERENLDRDESKEREVIGGDERRVRKDIQTLQDQSFDAARRATQYRIREQQRCEAAAVPNSLSLTGLPDRLAIVAGSVSTPVCIQGSSLVVNVTRPAYMADVTSSRSITSNRKKDLAATSQLRESVVLEPGEITNEEWLRRKAMWHHAVIAVSILEPSAPPPEVLFFIFSFTAHEFALVNDTVLVRRATGEHVANVSLRPQDVRVTLEPQHATLATVQSLLHSLFIVSRAKATFECQIRLTVQGAFGIPTSTFTPAAAVDPSVKRSRSNLTKSTPGSSSVNLTVGAPPPVSLEESFVSSLEGTGFSPEWPLNRSQNPRGRRVLQQIDVTHTFEAFLHPPVLVMGELAMARIVYAENAGELPLLTGIESICLDLPSYDGIIIRGDMGSLVDTSDAIIFGPKTGITVEKHTVSVDGGLLATITVPGALTYPSNKAAKEVGMPTRFEIVLRATATQEGLFALLRSLCFRNDSSAPISGARHLRLVIVVPRTKLYVSTAIDVDVVQEDQPTVFDIGFAPVVCRSPNAVADDLINFVSSFDNPCYFAMSSVVYDFDTADFSGGYLRLFCDPAETEIDPSAITLRVVPYAGSSLALQTPHGGTLWVDDVDVGTLTYQGPADLTVKFNENASVIAVGVILRNVAFHSNSDKGQVRIVQCVFVAGASAPVNNRFEVLLDDAIVQHATGMVRVPSGIGEPKPLGPFILSSSHGQWDGGFILIDFPGTWTSEDQLFLVPGGSSAVALQPLAQRDVSKLHAELALLISASVSVSPAAAHRRTAATADAAGFVPERKGLNNKAFLRRKLTDKLRDVVNDKARAHEDTRLRQLLILRKAYNLSFTESSFSSGARAVFVDGAKVATLISTHSAMLLLFDGAKKPSYSLSPLKPETASGSVPQRAVATILNQLHFTGNMGLKVVRFSGTDGHPHMSVYAMHIEIGCSDEVTQLIRPVLAPRTFRCRTADDDNGFCLFGDVTLANSVIHVFNGAVIEAGFIGNAQSGGDQLSILSLAQQKARGWPPDRWIVPAAVVTGGGVPTLVNNDDDENSQAATLRHLTTTQGGGVCYILLGEKRIGLAAFDTPNVSGTSNIKIVFDPIDPSCDGVDDIQSNEQARNTPGVISIADVQHVLNSITYTNVAATVKSGSRVCHCAVGHAGAEGRLSLVLAVKAATLFNAKPHNLPRLLAVQMDWNLMPVPESPGNLAHTKEPVRKKSVTREKRPPAFMPAPRAETDGSNNHATSAPKKAATDERVITIEQASSSDGGDADDDECVALLVCPEAVVNVPNPDAMVKSGSVSISIFRRGPQPSDVQATSSLPLANHSTQSSPGGVVTELLAPPGDTRVTRRSSQTVTAASDTSIIFSGGIDWSALPSSRQAVEDLPPHPASSTPPPQELAPALDLSTADDEVANVDNVFLSLDADFSLPVSGTVPSSFREELEARHSSRARRNLMDSRTSSSLASSPPCVHPSSIESRRSEMFAIGPDARLYVLQPLSEEDDDDDDDEVGKGSARSAGAETCPNDDPLSSSIAASRPTTPDRAATDGFDCPDGFRALYGGQIVLGTDGSWTLNLDYRSEMTISRLQSMLRHMKIIVRASFARRMLGRYGIHVFYVEVLWAARDGTADDMIVPVAAMPLNRDAAIANYHSVFPKETGNSQIAARHESVSSGTTTTKAPGIFLTAPEEDPPKSNAKSPLKSPAPSALLPTPQLDRDRSPSSQRSAPGRTPPHRSSFGPSLFDERSGPNFFQSLYPAFLSRSGVPCAVFNGVAIDKRLLVDALLDGLQFVTRVVASSLVRKRSTGAAIRTMSSTPEATRIDPATTRSRPGSGGVTSGTRKTLFFVLDVEVRLPRTIQATLTEAGAPLRVALESLECDPLAEGSSSKTASPFLPPGDLLDFDIQSVVGDSGTGTLAPRPPPKLQSTVKSFRLSKPTNIVTIADAITLRRCYLIRSSDTHFAFACRCDIDETTTTRAEAEKDAELFVNCADHILRTMTLTMVPSPTVASRQSERWMNVKISRSCFDTAGEHKRQGSGTDEPIDPFDISFGQSLRNRLLRRSGIDPRDRVHGLFKFALSILPSAVFVSGTVRRLGLRFRVQPINGAPAAARVSLTTNKLPAITGSSSGGAAGDGVYTSSSCILPLSTIFNFRGKQVNTFVNFREGGSAIVRLAFAANQSAPSGGFKFPRIVFDEAATTSGFQIRKAKERDIAAIINCKVADIAAPVAEIREITSDSKRVAAWVAGALPPQSFAAMGVSAAAAAGNHSALLHVPLASNGSSRTSVFFKLISSIVLDFTECNVPQPLSYTCSLQLTDEATGITDTTSVLIIKELVAADKPPRGRRGLGGTSRRAAVNLNSTAASLKGRPLSDVTPDPQGGTTRPGSTVEPIKSVRDSPVISSEVEIPVIHPADTEPIIVVCPPALTKDV